jgi:hypothetical protein
MADKHAYFQSPGHFNQLITHLRRTFPPTVTADTVKKLGLAPKNESYLLNTLRFLGLIDEAGNKTEVAGKVFSQHQDEAFQKEFALVVENAYPELFKLHGAEAWNLNMAGLITFFRQNDQSSAPVGKYQSNTFKSLAALAGHGDAPEPKSQKQEARQKTSPAPKQKRAEAKATKTTAPVQPLTELPEPSAIGKSREFALTVRVEINLPAEGDQETYDRIFKSIRENLLNG